jgi:CHAT domain-containing protein
VTVDAGQVETIAVAEAAHRLVETDPARAAAMAEGALRQARARREREAEVLALHALGFARHELGDARAVRTLRAAVRVGERHGYLRRAAMARRPLAFCLAYGGALAAAQRELDAADAALDGIERARSEVFRFALLHLAGQAPTSLVASQRAVATLRRAGDGIWEARLLGNRGLLLAELGDADAAEPDLLRARDLFASQGATAAALGTDYELARVSLARGDLPTCLARLDAIEAAGGVPAMHNSSLELLRAKALVAARLIGEARESLDAAQDIWRRAGVDDPDGRLEVARLTLLAGEPDRALALAERTRRSFSAQRRTVHAADAHGLTLAAAVAAGAVRTAMLRSGRRAVAALTAAGRSDLAVRVQLTVARVAIELGRPAVARRELEGCASLRRRGPVADRIEIHHVEALVAAASGDPRGAQRAARTGLALLEQYRAALGAAELRATASAIGAELARLGLRVAVDDGGPAGVLEWAERLRASALRMTPVTPPDSPVLRERATDLRRVTAEIRRAEAAGRPARALVARQAALEQSIRRLSRHDAAPTRRAASGDGDAPAPARRLAAALGPAVLVEMVELDGELGAVTLVDGRLAHHPLCAAGSVAEQLEWLRFALARLARGDLRPSQRDSALAGARASADELAAMLLDPLAETTGPRPLIIVPTGLLHGVPWAALPTLRDRPVTVAPSAATWLMRQAPGSRRPRKVVLVAGPRLRHAAAELAGVSASHPGCTVLRGRAATVAATLRALDGATVAHLACHGRFRADSPLFSALELADGSLNVYALQRLRRVPELIVLSACDLAISDARPGDELLGFAAALIGMGARTVIASTTPAPDAAARRLMIDLHSRLISGVSPAHALSGALAARRPRDLALTGFICLGAG